MKKIAALFSALLILAVATVGLGLGYRAWRQHQAAVVAAIDTSRGIDEARFLRAYVTELRHWAELAPGRRVTSVFLGGGTPSLMSAATVGAILDAINGAWNVGADAEITLEANPSSVEAGRFRGYRAAGVNRVSLGVQSLDDAELRTLGRLHSVQEELAAIDVAHTTFERCSFDMIYDRPGQTPQAWRTELGQALALAVRHLSL